MPIWKEEYIPVNKWTRPGTKLKKVVKLVDHYTANPGASARNHVIYFGKTLPAANDSLVKQGKRNQTRSASAHIFVDKYEAICIVPLDEVTYAVNDGSYRGIKELLPNANFLTINVEKCIERDGSFHPDTIVRAAQVFAELCKMFNLDPIDDIVRHYDVTHKNCPALYVKNPNLFENFKRDVKTLMLPDVNKTEVKEENDLDEVETRALIQKVLKEEAEKRQQLDVSTWAEKDWKEAIASGYTDGSNPRDYVTKEVMITVDRRVINNIKKYVAEPLEIRIAELEKQIKGAE